MTGRGGEDLTYAKDGKMYAKQNLEIYIPQDYFASKIAVDVGSHIETFGLLFIKSATGGDIKLLNIPGIISMNIYDTAQKVIHVKGQTIVANVYTFLKDSVIMGQHVIQGREVAEKFLDFVLSGKLPKSLDYTKLINIWWSNLEISGVDFKVPSLIYELIYATIYRDPHNMKKRFGQIYGKQSTPNPYAYETGDIRTIVANLSTFSGMVHEHMNRMITSGINNSMEGLEEPVSPLEKIIYY